MPTPIYGFWLKVNGTDISDVGAFPEQLKGQWDAPALNVAIAAIIGDDGVTAETDEPDVEPMEYTAVLTLTGDDASDFENNRDALMYLLSFPELQLSGGNRPDRYRIARYVGPMNVEMRNFDAADEAQCTFKLLCLKPIQYATTTTTVADAAGVDIPTPLGNWRSRPVITLTGATNPVLTYKNHAGVTVRTMTLSGTGNIVIDCANETITIGGVDSPEAKTAGDFIRLDPRDGNMLASQWPSIRSSSGAVSVAYPQAWL